MTMTGLSVPFHALPDELLALVSAFMDEARVYAFAVRYEPFEAFLVEKGELASVLRDPSVRTVFLSLGPPALPVSTLNELYHRNPSRLTLDIGRHTDAGLRESWLTARTDDEEAIRMWRKVARRLKAMTRTGAIVVNPTTGATGPSRNNRFSAGAKALDAEGVPMLAIAGTNRFRFEG